MSSTLIAIEISAVSVNTNYTHKSLQRSTFSHFSSLFSAHSKNIVCWGSIPYCRWCSKAIGFLGITWPTKPAVRLLPLLSHIVLHCLLTIGLKLIWLPPLPSLQTRVMMPSAPHSACRQKEPTNRKMMMPRGTTTHPKTWTKLCDLTSRMAHYASRAYERGLSAPYGSKPCGYCGT